jgi:hypothetical protein
MHSYSNRIAHGFIDPITSSLDSLAMTARRICMYLVGCWAKYEHDCSTSILMPVCVSEASS